MIRLMNQQLRDYLKIECKATKFKRKRLVLKQLYTLEFLFYGLEAVLVFRPLASAQRSSALPFAPLLQPQAQNDQTRLTPQSFHAPTPKEPEHMPKKIECSGDSLAGVLEDAAAHHSDASL